MADQTHAVELGRIKRLHFPLAVTLAGPCCAVVLTGRTLLFARRSVKDRRSEGLHVVQSLVQSLRYLLLLHPLQTMASTDSTCIHAGQELEVARFATTVYTGWCNVTVGLHTHWMEGGWTVLAPESHAISPIIRGITGQTP